MRGILGGLPPVQSVLFAGVGLVGTPILEGVLNPILPVSITSNTFGKYAVRIGSVLGLTWLTKAVLGGARARMVGLGGGVYVLTTALREFAPGLIPGMSAYTAPALAAYTPATGRNFRTLGAVGPGQTVGSPLMMSRARFGNR